MEKDRNTYMEELKNQIEKDTKESERIGGQVKRYQERKKTIDLRIRENKQTLQNLENEKVADTIKGVFGEMDDRKLELLSRLLKEHKGEILKKEQR